MELLKKKMKELDLNAFDRPKGDKGYRGHPGISGENGKQIHID